MRAAWYMMGAMMGALLGLEFVPVVLLGASCAELVRMLEVKRKQPSPQPETTSGLHMVCLSEAGAGSLIPAFLSRTPVRRWGAVWIITAIEPPAGTSHTQARGELWTVMLKKIS